MIMRQLIIFCVVLLIISVIVYTLGDPSYKPAGVSGMVIAGLGIVIYALLLVPPSKEAGLPSLVDDLSHLNPMRPSNYTPAGGKRRRRHR